ncbi:hypothetical protein QGM71_17280 [Virgibacillus sp. C22-A2]|uniref:WYL domain-containing protein n=1 Tax=Virgibacillus tibetensis TaxID=3042313 RepID=A0ABU6KJC1_9BACI|nr:hypothetical protein [Virgibacillus sp. C22-A2]
MKGLLIRSMENKERIILFYMDQNHNVTQRFIKVLSVNNESIAAYCYWRKRVRIFKLENILSAGAVRKRVGA